MGEIRDQGMERDESVFQGTELDEPVAGPDGISGTGGREETGPEIIAEPEIPVKGKKGRTRRWIAVVLAGLLAGGAAACLVMLHFVPGTREPVRSEGPPAGPVVRCEMPRPAIVVFEPFVVPMEKSRRFTYVSLRLSVGIPGSYRKKELMEKREAFRGAVYDDLVREIGRSDGLPPLWKIKECVLSRLKRWFPGEGVVAVYITDFVAV